MARADLAAAGLLLALALAFVAPALPPDRVWAPADIPLTAAPFRDGPQGLPRAQNGLLGDVIYQELPWRLLAQREFAAGRFPLWNDTSLHGAPLFGNGQSALLYPLNLLWIALPVGRAAALIAALKLWLAGLGMLVFLRGRRLRPAAALLAAIGWMFCAPLVVWLGWPQTNVLLLLPPICAAVERWCVGGRPGALAALAALIALAAFGGHAETLQNVILVAAIWAAALLLGQPAPQAARRLPGLLGAGALGAGLAAVQLLPFAETLLLSREWVARDLAGPPFAPAFPAEYLWTWLVPNFFGYPPAGLGWGSFNYNEQTGYIGLAPLLGAALALLGAARRQIPRRPVLAWAAVALLAGLLAYANPLGAQLRGLPPLDRSINLRWIGPGAFALLVLAAHGWDGIMGFELWILNSRRGAGGGARRMAAVGWALALVGGLIMAAHLAGVPAAPIIHSPLRLVYDPYRAYWALWAAGVGAAAVGLTLLWGSGPNPPAPFPAREGGVAAPTTGGPNPPAPFPAREGGAARSSERRFARPAKPVILSAAKNLLGRGSAWRQILRCAQNDKAMQRATPNDKLTPRAMPKDKPTPRAIGSLSSYAHARLLHVSVAAVGPDLTWSETRTGEGGDRLPSPARGGAGGEVRSTPFSHRSLRLCVSAVNPMLRREGWAPVVLGGVLLVDLWRVGFGYNPVVPAGAFYPADPLLDRMAALPATARVLVDGREPLPGLNTAYGIRDWRTQDPAAPARADVVAGLLSPATAQDYALHYNMQLLAPRRDLAALLGLDYALLPAGTDPNAGAPAVAGAPAFRRLAAEGGLMLGKSRAAAPFAYLAGQATRAGDEAAARAWLAATTWTRVLARAAVLEAPAAGFAPRTQPAGSAAPGAVAVTTYTPGRIDLQVTAPAPAWLIVNESWGAGWQARVDGQPAPLWRANYLVQGLAVPAGAHQVTLRYEPASVRWGTAITAISVLLWAALGLWAVRRAWRARPSRRRA